jgi:hypothetical protein
MARAVLTLSPLGLTFRLWLTSTVAVAVTIVATMTSAMPPARVATIPAIRIIVAFRAVPVPVSVVVLCRGMAQSQATETENHQRKEHYRSLNFHIAPSSGPPLILTGRLRKRGFQQHNKNTGQTVVRKPRTAMQPDRWPRRPRRAG